MVGDSTYLDYLDPSEKIYNIYTGLHSIQIRKQIKLFSSAYPHIQIRFVFQPIRRWSSFFRFHHHQLYFTRVTNNSFLQTEKLMTLKLHFYKIIKFLKNLINT